jgi:dipeptidyl aminopeptidase/acylaminoacyl peptidase
LQLVNALIAAHKDFDLLVLPNRSHGLIDLTAPSGPGPRTMDPYFIRRLWDFFVTHLMRVDPQPPGD